MVPYASIEAIETQTQEKITAARIFLVGIFAWGWKKKRLFMVIKFKDAAGLSQSMVFDMENIEHVQPQIYNRVVSFRGSTGRG